jgi:hypothetical protein
MPLAEAIQTLTDLKDDLFSVPVFGLTLSQGDCVDCGRALAALLGSHNAFMEERIAWQETREGMNR